MMNSRIALFMIVALAFACKPYENIPVIREMSDLTYPYANVKSVEVLDGIKVAYADEGSGDEVIIFIHGLGSYMPAWQRNIEVLKNNYRCIAIDLPGYGKSSKGNYDYSMLFYANVVADFMDKLSIGKASIAGHSMGGQIAVTLGLYHPQKVKNLMLVAPAGFETFHEGQKQWFRDVMTPRLTKLTTVEMIQSNLSYNFYKMPKEAEFMITDRIAIRAAKDFDWYCLAIAKSVKGMVDQPVFDFLPELAMNTLIVFGENDNLIPNRYLNPGFTKAVAEAGHKQIPNSKLVMAPKSGHFTHFEHPEVFNSAVVEFLSNK